jgi:hypothetical protein
MLVMQGSDTSLVNRPRQLNGWLTPRKQQRLIAVANVLHEVA